ncbi:agmatine/peptidylarginine deiminase [Pendulispora albinea]|uniref:Agmatine deiminase family protein n=1 Tax=Pendulispora albinea TaxID=2741071 RepID=A0ABZ2M4V4_9BACT
MTNTTGVGRAPAESCTRVSVPEREVSRLGGVRWFMPGEAWPHERTWMAWPTRRDLWGDELGPIQQTIVRLARAIAEVEPVTLVVPPEHACIAAAACAPRVSILPMPIDDIWMRDTGPCFLLDEHGDLAAGILNFNGWGGKQAHDHDATLARRIAEHLGIPQVASDVVGEGGGLEVDGAGTLLAAASCWQNANRNPGRSRAQIEESLRRLLGVDHFIWVPGLAGRDITDGHIDGIARFVRPGVVLVELPAEDDPRDPAWVSAIETRDLLREAHDLGGKRLEVVEVRQPRTVRSRRRDFVNSYVNFHVANHAVFAPEFGDLRADRATKEILAGLFPGRQIVQLNVDRICEGGGGIHCVTQQQPQRATPV